MSHTYTNCLIHYVFSTKGREPVLTVDIRERIWSFIGGIARKNQLKPLIVGGAVDHTHILVSLPATVSIAKAIQLLKGGSSLFIRETFPSCNRFEWQEGYGAFTIGASAVPNTMSYIRNQEEHHRVRSFKEEYIAFLKKNNVSYDERYVFD